MRGQETVSDKPPHSPLKIIKDYAGSNDMAEGVAHKRSPFVGLRNATALDRTDYCAC